MGVNKILLISLKFLIMKICHLGPQNDFESLGPKTTAKNSKLPKK
jgi:hypothetical protein